MIPDEPTYPKSIICTVPPTREFMLSSKTRTSQSSLARYPDADEHVCAFGFLVCQPGFCAGALLVRSLLESALDLNPFEFARERCLLLSLSGRGCWKFELPADLLGTPLGKGSNRDTATEKEAGTHEQ